MQCTRTTKIIVKIVRCTVELENVDMLGTTRLCPGYRIVLIERCLHLYVPLYKQNPNATLYEGTVATLPRLYT